MKILFHTKGLTYHTTMWDTSPGMLPKPNHMFCMTFQQYIRPKLQFAKIQSHSSHGMTNTATVGMFLSSKAQWAPNIEPMTTTLSIKNMMGEVSQVQIEIKKMAV